MTREEAFMKKQESFRTSAFFIINKMVELASKRERPAHPSVLVDEVLHSIFFLGEINNPKYSPERILDDDEMLESLRKKYPQPFGLFASQLPRRSPFSCVLDMIVNLRGQNYENEILDKLRGLIQQLRTEGGTALVSSAICVSQKNTAQDSVRHYGVSMSISGRDPRRIIIAASCLSYWNKFIADAVMTYYPGKQKKTYFDGTISLPEQVRCDAFSLSDGTPMAPCRLCGNMFGLTTQETMETVQWPYGNCAEAESLSNLLNNENEITVQQSGNTDANRQEAENSLHSELTLCLGRVNFGWDNNFYIPQGN